MDKKVILMSIDGMRPDGLMQCGSEHLEKLNKQIESAEEESNG